MRLGFIAVCFLLSIAAQTVKSDRAIHHLEKIHPEVQWERRSAAIADVNCDRKPEVIVLGKQSSQAVIAVVSDDSQDKIQLLSFPTGGATQDSFCAIPTRIEVNGLDCDSDLGPLPGCKPVKGCQEFSVADDECDSFNFYWDSSHESLSWWRH